MSEKSSDLNTDVSSSHEEKEESHQTEHRSSRRRSCLILSILAVITAVVGAVAAWQRLKAEQEDLAASQTTPHPPSTNEPPNTSPFGTNHAPIPPPLGDPVFPSSTESKPSNDCPAICVSEHFDAMVDDLYYKFAPNLHYLQTLVVETWWVHVDGVHSSSSRNGNAAVDRSVAIEQLKDIAVKLGRLANSVTRDDIAEFYAYYVLRSLYGEMFVGPYFSLHWWSSRLLDQCNPSFGGVSCPKTSDQIDSATATQYLLNHADNTFSSICSSGLPLPWWSEPDGSGYLFHANNKTGKMYPVSGSGVNMSAPINSLTDYFTYQQRHDHSLVDFKSREWNDMVESNPVYAWFMASMTPADKGTICENGDLNGMNKGTSIDIAFLPFRTCTESDIPNADNPGTGNYSKQHFARMWYDMGIREAEKWKARGVLDFENQAAVHCCSLLLSQYLEVQVWPRH